MSETKDAAKRSRFGNVINKNTVAGESWGDEAGRFGTTAQEMAVVLNAQDLGYCVATLEPGKRSCPYHFHHSEEELFVVLEGHATLRQGDDDGEEEIPVGPGDFISFPPGTGVAHHFVNNHDVPFVFLAVSTRVKADVAEYPDSNKVLIRSNRMMLRREPVLPYFEGES